MTGAILEPAESLEDAPANRTRNFKSGEKGVEVEKMIMKSGEKKCTKMEKMIHETGEKKCQKVEKSNVKWRKDT